MIRNNMIRRLTCPALAVILIFASTVTAGTIDVNTTHYGLNSAAVVQASGGPNEFSSTGWQTNVPPYTLTTNGYNGNGRGATTMTVDADYGRLHVSGSGTAVGSRGDGALSGIQNNGSYVAQFRDRLNILSPTLADGTPVDVRLTYSFSGNVSASGDEIIGNTLFGNFVHINGYLHGTTNFNGGGGTSTVPVGAYSDPEHNVGNTPALQNSILIHAAVGSYVDLTATLGVAAAAVSDGYTSRYFAFDGSLITAVELMYPVLSSPAASEIFLSAPADIVAAGDAIDAYYVAASGATYAVPEPESGAMLGLIALGGLLLLAGRRPRCQMSRV